MVALASIDQHFSQATFFAGVQFLFLIGVFSSVISYRIEKPAQSRGLSVSLFLV